MYKYRYIYIISKKLDPNDTILLTQFAYLQIISNANPISTLRLK